MHPDVSSGKKSEEEALIDFMEIFEINHNTFNNYQKTNSVGQPEFMEYYRIVSANYEDDQIFEALVKNSWGIKFEKADVAKSGWAGGKDEAGDNSRARYQKANAKGTPFGTSGQEKYESST